MGAFEGVEGMLRKKAKSGNGSGDRFGSLAFSQKRQVDLQGKMDKAIRKKDRTLAGIYQTQIGEEMVNRTRLHRMK